MAGEKQGFDSGIHEVLRQLDFSLTQAQIDALFAHYSLLKKWNERMNLTGIRTLHEVIWRHFGESLAVARVIGPGRGKVVDVGSGGGFPGFPISICWPARPVALVESVGKKAVFLQEVARLQPSVTVYSGRFEDFHESAEWGVVRAVSLDGIAGHMREVAGSAAVLVSRDQLTDAKGRFDSSTLQVTTIPWNVGIRIVSGRLGELVPRETATSDGTNVSRETLTDP